MSNTVQKILPELWCSSVDSEITAFLFVSVKEYNLINLLTSMLIY